MADRQQLEMIASTYHLDNLRLLYVRNDDTCNTSLSLPEQGELVCYMANPAAVAELVPALRTFELLPNKSQPGSACSSRSALSIAEWLFRTESSVPVHACNKAGDRHCIPQAQRRC